MGNNCDSCKRLRERLSHIEQIAIDPAFSSDAMGWIALECWKAKTIECVECAGVGWRAATIGSADCAECNGRGRIANRS